MVLERECKDLSPTLLLSSLYSCDDQRLFGIGQAGSTPVVRSTRFNAEAAKPNHSNDSQLCRHLLDHTIFAELLSSCCHERA